MGIDGASIKKTKNQVPKTFSFKKMFNAIGYTSFLFLLALFVYALADELNINLFVFIFVWVIPFPLNYYLAVTRGKNVALMLLLTVVFCWLVTLILAFLPLHIQKDKAN